MSAQPSVLPSRGKAVIDQRAALTSILRTWLVYRDDALWAFVGGVEASDPVEEITLDETVQEHISRCNEARKRALKLAERMAEESEQKPSQVIRRALDDLLATETPQFLLSHPNIPGSF